MTEVAPTNGSAPKAPSALTKLLKSLDGAKKPNASDVKAVSAKFKSAMGKRAELEKALKDFDASNDALAVEMVKCHGAKHITVEGVRYVPTSRADRVYYKRMTDTHDTVEL